MNEVIKLIEQKLEDSKNYPITNQEEENMHIHEIICLGKLLRLSEELTEDKPF